MKPILFNTEMVQAILAGQKTVTRRAVKPQPDKHLTTGKNALELLAAACAPYQTGDILYVRETWQYAYDLDGNERIIEGTGRYLYAADGETPFNEWIMPDGTYRDCMPWRPSIHMPKEAARLFLLVTGIKVKRVQDITDEEARREGCKDRDDFRRVWNDCYSKPQPVKVKGVIDHYESYPWEDIQETRTYRGKPWHVIGNPWAWGIEFERISKEEALKHDVC